MVEDYTHRGFEMQAETGPKPEDRVTVLVTPDDYEKVKAARIRAGAEEVVQIYCCERLQIHSHNDVPNYGHASFEGIHCQACGRSILDVRCDYGRPSLRAHLPATVVNGADKERR